MTTDAHLTRHKAECPNRDEREADGAIFRGFDRPLAVAKTGIAGKHDVATGERHDKARPERAVAIDAPAAAPVVVARDDHIDTGLDRNPLTPVARNGGNSCVLHDGLVAQTGDDQRLVTIPQFLERAQVHVIIMVVTDDHDIDLGQIVERDARYSHPARTDAERPSGCAEDRIGEDIETI